MSGSQGGAIRVGAVSYLNARPLYYGFDRFAPGARLTLDLPSRLAENLAAGNLDVALIPSVEYLRGAAQGLGYEILPGFAIAARGPVRSVKLFCRVPYGSIHRLALDEGSRTSQVLARIWLDVAQGVRPEQIESLPMGASIFESTADAILLIGDRAMKVPDEPFHAVVDLAEAWNTLTGLPFVFALWVVRRGLDLADLPDALARCRAEGLDHAGELADCHGPQLGLDRALCLEYLTKILSYDLGDLELAGLRQFARMATVSGLVPEGVDLVFHDRRLGFAARC